MQDNVILGHDTEYFVVDGDGKPVPAHTIFPDKAKAKKFTIKAEVWDADAGDYRMRTFKEKGLRGSYYRDGYALEINSRPSTCRGYLWNDMQFTLRHAAGEADKKDLKLSMLPYMDIDISELRKRDVPKDVKRFGCSPTFSAYSNSDEPSEITGNALSVPFRTIATHIHMGVMPNANWPEFEEAANSGAQAMSPWVKLADLLLGIPGTWLSPYPELEFKRRKLYGKAGEFRIHFHPFFETYGIGANAEDYSKIPALEYRVLSTHMARAPELFSFATGMMRDVILPLGSDEKVRDLLTDDLMRDVRLAIDRGKNLDAMMKEWINFMKAISDSLHCLDLDEYDAVFEEMGIPTMKDWQEAKDTASYFPHNYTRYMSKRDGHNGATQLFGYGEECDE